MRNLKRFMAITLICLATGCSSTPEQTESDRQNAILADPMGYKPSVGQDVGGGDTTNFDKSGFNNDMHDLLNP